MICRLVLYIYQDSWKVGVRYPSPVKVCYEIIVLLSIFPFMVFAVPQKILRVFFHFSQAFFVQPFDYSQQIHFIRRQRRQCKIRVSREIISHLLYKGKSPGRLSQVWDAAVHFRIGRYSRERHPVLGHYRRSAEVVKEIHASRLALYRKTCRAASLLYSKIYKKTERLL